MSSHSLDVLLVSQVTEGRVVGGDRSSLDVSVGLSSESSSLPLTFLDFVLLDEDEPDDEDQDELKDCEKSRRESVSLLCDFKTRTRDRQTIGNEHRANTKLVLGTLLGLVEEGRGDVAGMTGRGREDQPIALHPRYSLEESHPMHAPNQIMAEVIIFFV